MTAAKVRPSVSATAVRTSLSSSPSSTVFIVSESLQATIVYEQGEEGR